MSTSKLVVWYRALPGGIPRTVKGRVAWALIQLAAAGSRGCTSHDTPAPRWAAYVHRLRERGLHVVTFEEEHGGPFAGCHVRYVLGGPVAVGSTLEAVVAKQSNHTSIARLSAPKTDELHPATAQSADTGDQNARD